MKLRFRWPKQPINYFLRFIVLNFLRQMEDLSHFKRLKCHLRQYVLFCKMVNLTMNMAVITTPLEKVLPSLNFCSSHISHSSCMYNTSWRLFWWACFLLTSAWCLVGREQQSWQRHWRRIRPSLYRSKVQRNLLIGQRCFAWRLWWQSARRNLLTTQWIVQRFVKCNKYNSSNLFCSALFNMTVQFKKLNMKVIVFKTIFFKCA